MSANTENTRREYSLYRWEVLGRVFAAIFGGYIFALGAGILLTRTLPFSKSSLVMTASLASFALYAVAIIWVFSVKRFRTLWYGVAGAAALLALALVLV